jgi:hypothetical protein
MNLSFGPVGVSWRSCSWGYFAWLPFAAKDVTLAFIDAIVRRPRYFRVRDSRIRCITSEKPCAQDSLRDREGDFAFHAAR